MKTLTQMVQESAKKVENTPLVLYAASAFCGRVARAFRNAGIHPVCICDGDIYKQGKNYYGLEVISPAEAVAKYPNAKFCITSFFHMPEIIRFLIGDMGILPEQILNYEEVEWRRGCPYLESEAYFFADSSKMDFCCSEFEKQKAPSVKIDENYHQSADKFVQCRDRMILDLQSGISDSACAYCAFFKEGFYFVHRKVRKIAYNNSGGCNFNCIYCNNNAKRPVDLKSPDPVSFKAFLSALEQQDYLSDNVKFIISPGEFTIHPERSQLYELCDYAEYILTNGSIYDENVSKILANGNLALNISIDAGTRKTYKKVKGIDCFDKVINNINQYTDNANSSVHLKYIFLPGINDNREDVEGFVDLCSSSRIEYVFISYDFNLKLNEVSDHTLRMIKLMTKSLDTHNILCADLFGVTKVQNFKAIIV